MKKDLNVIVYQVDSENTREWGFLPLELFKTKHHGEHDINSFNMETSKHLPVIATSISSGTSHSEKIQTLHKLYELTNSGTEESDKFRQEHKNARAISTGDIVIFFDGNEVSAYYCDSYSWEKLESVYNYKVLPLVGMYATGWHFSDYYAYEVVSVSPSGKTIQARRLSSQPAEGYDYFSNQVHIFTSEEGYESTTFRWSEKFGVFKASSNDGGMKLSVGHAREYRDPTF